MNAVAGARRHGLSLAQCGLTLVELMVALALMVTLASLALPSMLSALQRQSLKGAAESLAADLAEARFEAVRRGLTLHVGFVTGVDGCWAIATQPACDCRSRQACQVKLMPAADLRRVEIVDAHPIAFVPESGGIASGPGGQLLLQTAAGHRLQVQLSGLGRPRICAPEAAVPPYPAC
jgi:type IV fimbrial biogenesis protein FimT